MKINVLIVLFIAVILFFCGILDAVLSYIEDGYIGLLSGLAMIGISMFGFVSGYRVFNTECIPNKIPYSVEHIISLKDNKLTQGSKYCVQTDMYYNYIVDCGKGGFVHNRVPSNKAYIFYDNKNPRVEWYDTTQFYDQKILWFHIRFYCPTGDIYKIYLPEGSIDYKYNIDLE